MHLNYKQGISTTAIVVIIALIVVIAGAWYYSTRPVIPVEDTQGVTEEDQGASVGDVGGDVNVGDVNEDGSDSGETNNSSVVE